jgi:hypothetical protein
MKFLLFFIVFIKTIYASDFLDINLHRIKSYSQEIEIINPNKLLCSLRNNTPKKISFSLYFGVNDKIHYLKNRILPQKNFDIFLNDLCEPQEENFIFLKKIRIHKEYFIYTLNIDFNMCNDYIIYINFDNNQVLNIHKSYIFEKIEQDNENVEQNNKTRRRSI